MDIVIPGFRILRELGRGGMATVYLAVQESLAREVAIKVLAPELAVDPAFAEPFLREARMEAAVRHPNIIAVFDAGCVNGNLYLAMEYLPYGSAAELRGGDPQLIRQCLRDVCRGLQHLHARAIVHGDLKPENILRRDDGSYVISDFGIARVAKRADEPANAATRFGTPAYMSPEQWQGQTPDARADLYSLGIVTHELLTGALPFQEQDPQRLADLHCTSPRPRLPEAYRDWQFLLDGLLAIAPAQRFANAAQVLAAIEPAHREPVFAPLPIRRRPKRGLYFALAMLVVALVIVLALRTWAERLDRDHDTPVAGEKAERQADQLGKSIAVLPLQSEVGDIEDQYFADGLSEELITRLAAINGLRVAGRTSSFAWRDRSGSARMIAQSLSVRYLLQGSLRRHQGQVRIDTRLLDADSGSTIWTGNFERPEGDVFELQTQIASSVIDRLALTIGTDTVPTLQRLPVDKRAHYLEHLGRIRSGNAESWPAAERYLSTLAGNGELGPDGLLRLVLLTGALQRRALLPAAEARSQLTDLVRQLNAEFSGTPEAIIASGIERQNEGDISLRLRPHREALRFYQQAGARTHYHDVLGVQAAHAARAILDFPTAEHWSALAIAAEPDDAMALFTRVAIHADAGKPEQALEELEAIADRFPDSVYAQGDLARYVLAAGQVAEFLNMTSDCAALSNYASCEFDRALALRLLGFEGAAEHALAAFAEMNLRNRQSAQWLRALWRGELPDDREIYRQLPALLQLMSWREAWAQSDANQLARYLDWTTAPFAVDAATEAGNARSFATRYVLFRAAQQQSAGEAKAAQAWAGPVRETYARVADNATPYLVETIIGAHLVLGEHAQACARMRRADRVHRDAVQVWLWSPSRRETPYASLLGLPACADLRTRLQKWREQQRALALTVDPGLR